MMKFNILEIFYHFFEEEKIIENEHIFSNVFIILQDVCIDL